MKLFIDTANVEWIREMYDLGIICGATTNPTLIAKEGKDFYATIREICDIFDDDGIVFGEVLSLEADKMVEEAKALTAISPKIVVKIPMCPQGMKAVHELSKLGIRTAVTLVFSAAQALICAAAGATMIAPFVGRLDDIGVDGLQVVEEICALYRSQNIQTKVLCASLKQPNHVIQASIAGIDYATIPYPVLKQCMAHPLSTEGIDLFLKDWAALQERLGNA